MVRLAVSATCAAAALAGFAAAQPVPAAIADQAAASPPSLLADVAPDANGTAQLQTQPTTIVDTSSNTTTTAVGVGAAVLELKLTNVLGQGYPTVTFVDIFPPTTDGAVSAAASLAPTPPGTMLASAAASVDPVATSKKICGDLAKAAVLSLLTDNPAPIITAAVTDFVDLFTMLLTGGSAPDPIKEFQKVVDEKLNAIQGQITQITQIVDQIVGLDTQILRGIQDAELNDVLSLMNPVERKISSAFQQLASLGGTIVTSNSTDPATRDNAIAAVYKLLNTDDQDPDFGPDQIFKAMTTYQRYVLGSGGSRGVLSFMPQMVQNGWEACASNMAGAMDFSFDNREVLYGDKMGPYHDSVSWITKTCVQQAYTKLADDGGRTVQTVFGGVLAVQLKAFALLTAAYANDPLYQSDLMLAAKGVKAITTQMAGLWGTITAPKAVNSAATKFIQLHAEKLGNRAAQDWTEMAPPMSNPPPTHYTGCPAGVCARDWVTFSLPDKYNPTMVFPCVAPASAFDFTINDNGTTPGYAATAFMYMGEKDRTTGANEYVYTAKDDAYSTSKIPAPHTNLPKSAPAFLDGIAQAFSDVQ